MLIIGLTGSTSTGKSTVSRILASAPYNLPIIDADLLSRKVTAPGTRESSQIIDYFGPTTPGLLNADGGLNRAALGNRIFGSPDWAVLNRIIQPRVRKEIYAVLAAYVKGNWAVVVDIPLLFEIGLDLGCGAVVVMSVASLDVQLQRLMARDGFVDRDDALLRIVCDLANEEKVERTLRIYGKRGRGWVVNNDGDVEELRVEVERVVAEVERGRKGWRRLVLWGLPPVAAVVGVRVIVGNWWSRRVWMKGREET